MQFLYYFLSWFSVLLCFGEWCGESGPSTLSCCAFVAYFSVCPYLWIGICLLLFLSWVFCVLVLVCVPPSWISLQQHTPIRIAHNGGA